MQVQASGTSCGDRALIARIPAEPNGSFGSCDTHGSPLPPLIIPWRKIWPGSQLPQCKLISRPFALLGETNVLWRCHVVTLWHFRWRRSLAARWMWWRASISAQIICWHTVDAFDTALRLTLSSRHGTSCSLKGPFPILPHFSSANHSSNLLR